MQQSPSSNRTGFIIYLFSLTVVGSLGYYYIGGSQWSLVDSIYMTIITLSTVGFGEVHQLNEIGKIWTMLIVIFGVSGFAVMLSKFGSELVELSIYRRRKMLKRIRRIKKHYIICGFGRMGAVIAAELAEKGIPFIILDNKTEKIAKIEEFGYEYIQADATLEESLLAARADEAAGIVVTLATEQDNLFVTMSARILNPNAYILSRCSQLDTKNKLKRAGANKVVNPYIAGGHKMAELLIQPTIQDTVSISMPETELDLVIDEFAISDLEYLDGVMIKDSKLREDYNLMIVGISDSEGFKKINPDPHTVLNPDNRILLLGTQEAVETLRKVNSV